MIKPTFVLYTDKNTQERTPFFVGAIEYDKTIETSDGKNIKANEIPQSRNVYERWKALELDEVDYNDDSKEWNFIRFSLSEFRTKWTPGGTR